MSYFHVPLVITDQIVTMMEANLANIKQALGDFEITAEALALLPMMGIRRFAFHLEAYKYAKQFPHILYHNRNMPSYDQVKTNYEKLSPVYAEMAIVFRTFTVIMKVLGSNTFVHGLSTYEAINATNNDGVQGIEVPRKELAPFFKGQGVPADDDQEKNGNDAFVPNSNGSSSNTPGDGNGSNG